MDKTVIINGTNNRYQINKVRKETEKTCGVKIRKVTEKWGLSLDYFSTENQINIINKLHEYNPEVSLDNKIIIRQIENKLNGYKHQDVIKKRYNDASFIKLDETINKLYDCQLNCFYCKEKTSILYEVVREMKQWTLDRVNNDLGHNTDNVIISCLDCNLKKKKTNKDAFLFTKQLHVVKS